MQKALTLTQLSVNGPHFLLGGSHGCQHPPQIIWAAKDLNIELGPFPAKDSAWEKRSRSYMPLLSYSYGCTAEDLHRLGGDGVLEFAYDASVPFSIKNIYRLERPYCFAISHPGQHLCIENMFSAKNQIIQEAELL